RISPGLTTVALSRAMRFDSRWTDPESSTFTSGRNALASMKCFCAKAPAPNTNSDSVATPIAANFFFDFNILLVSLEDSGQFSRFSFYEICEASRLVRLIGDAWERIQPRIHLTRAMPQVFAET